MVKYDRKTIHPSWPDQNKPGVPVNPHKSQWHWLGHYDDIFAVPWNAEGWWSADYIFVDIEEMADWVYYGPAIQPKIPYEPNKSLVFSIDAKVFNGGAMDFDIHNGINYELTRQAMLKVRAELDRILNEGDAKCPFGPAGKGKK